MQVVLQPTPKQVRPWRRLRRPLRSNFAGHQSKTSRVDCLVVLSRTSERRLSRETKARA